MKLATHLVEKREAVLEKWFEAIVKTYPRQTSEFLAKQKDRFRNPIGFSIEHAIGPIYDQIVTEMDTEDLLAALDGIVRIRSVQEFSPSGAVAFVFELKSIVREVLGDLSRDPERRDELSDIDLRVDRVALLAFDKYVECREQLFKIRTDEIRKQSIKLMERFNSKEHTSKPRAVEPRASHSKGEPVDDVI